MVRVSIPKLFYVPVRRPSEIRLDVSLAQFDTSIAVVGCKDTAGGKKTKGRMNEPSGMHSDEKNSAASKFENRPDSATHQELTQGL